MIKIRVYDSNRLDSSGSGVFMEITASEMQDIIGMRIAAATAMWPGTGWMTNRQALHNWFSNVDQSIVVQLHGHPQISAGRIAAEIVGSARELSDDVDVQIDSKRMKLELEHVGS